MNEMEGQTLKISDRVVTLTGH